MSGPDWFDRAEAELEAEYADGSMSLAEYNAAIRDLRAEYMAAADEAAENARDEFFGGW